MDCRENIYLFIWTLLCNQIVCIQYTPVDIGGLTDCALILHPNAQQYTSNLLQSDFGGPVNCITYDAINQAYLDARKRIDVPVVEEDWKSEEVAAVGQLILDVSLQIAKEFNLNQEDIEIGLPQIDAMKTAIKDICPVYLSAITCRAGKYRRHDGLCNNIDHPTWGATMTPFSRLLPPQFSDSISAPRISNSGKPLPTARMVSRTIHVDEGYHDHAGTVMLVAWGQFTDHDLTLMGTPLDSRNRNEPEECCYRPEHLKNPYCMEIKIPEDDYFYKKFNVRCQDFVRAFPGVQPNCKLGSRNPFNTLTAVIDGNTVYGVTEQFARQLRAGYGGLLKMNPAFSQLGLKELLPLKTDIPDEGCVRTNHSQFCFLAGEIRVNEQLVLTCVHTLMAREHNRIAKELSAINPHWDDEILYQEARRITVAEIQHVTYNEFLPLILGKEIMEKHGLVLNNQGYWDGYNPQANPGIMDAFSAAAFRFGHSLLPSAIERWSKVHKFIASKRLSELIRRPYDLYRAGVIDEYFMGLLNQVAQAMDDSVTQEVTNHLLKKPGNRFGLDLVSFNIQRGRDFGLPGYMYFRQHCGLPTADSFNDMFGSMPNSTIYRYMTIYESPWDIDLWSGGVSEKPLPGSMVGPTFACIIATQMSMTRQGDRFWYELPNQPSSFTPAQLQEIKKVKLSRILCDNTDLIDTVQIYAMVLPDHVINPRVPCRSSVLPKLDLSHWVDVPTKSFDDCILSLNVASIRAKVLKTHSSLEPLPLDDPLKTEIGTKSMNGREYVFIALLYFVKEGASAVQKFTQKAENQTTFIRKRDSASNESLTPSAYEYHIKTIAIIEGSNPLINVNDVVNSNPNIHGAVPYENYDSDHKISKRSVNSTGNVNATRRSDELTSSASAHIKNITSANTPTPGKDVTKRQSYHPRQKYRRPHPEAEMTQAIMDDSPQPDLDSNYRRSSISSADEEPDIESFFRQNVPIYDGVPIARKSSRFRTPESKRYHYYAPQEEEEEEEEEDKKPMKGFLEVDPELDSEHELVPMTLDESGRARIVDGEADGEDDDSPNLSYPPTYQSSYTTDDLDFKNVYHKPYNQPYRFEPSHSTFKSHDYDHTNGYSSDSPHKYGTSHQFNSLSDDQPRYYKHFSPSIRAQYDDEDNDRPSYSFPSTTHQTEYSKSPYYPNHDFVPKRGSPLHSSYTAKYPPRTTHVPQTLEEYHRIHGHFDMYKNKQKSRPYNPHSSVIVPQDDKEEDEEEKDITDTTKGPKSFVSLNFGTGLNPENGGVSIRHQIGHFKPKFSYSGSRPSFDDHDNNEFPAETVKEGSSSFSPESPKSIKSFVESVFKKKQKPSYDIPDTIIGKNYQPVSPYNPHFGERVKQRTAPSQNVLWHRKASTNEKRAARDKLSRNKNDRHLHEENTKMYDNLVKEHNFQPAKRNINDNKTPPNQSTKDEENEEGSHPAQSRDKPAENEDEEEFDAPQFNYWSQSSSDPN